MKKLLFAFIILILLYFRDEFLGYIPAEIYGIEISSKLVLIIVLLIISSIIGAAAYGVERGYYGKSKYLFKMKKDFDDTLYYDSKPVYIYAQIVEITPDNIEKRRPDLTRNIEIYSSDRFVNIGSTLMNGYYIEAPIRLNGEKRVEGLDTTDIYISYRGNEGIFKNIVEFKVK